MTLVRKSTFISRIAFCFVSVMLLFGVVRAQESTATPAPAPYWSYRGDQGPTHWGDLSSQYALCSTGHEQSPIDVTTPAVTSPSNLQFNYQSSVLTVENSGYSVQVDFTPGSSITLDGTAYTLKDFYFHAPSEHTLNRKVYPMELQLVHADQDGNLAIVSVLIDQTRPSNLAITSLWKVMQALKPTTWTVLGLSINAADLLPTDHSYYSYMGSLTTPPCTEGVRWIVMQTPILFGSAQIEQFTKLFQPSFRPVQPLNDRQITAYADDATSPATENAGS